MCTSLLLIALSGVITPATLDRPQWVDYGAALGRSEQENKPIAVVIGNGEKGWEQLSQEGKFNDAIQKRLARDFVCAYVDAREDEELAAAFRMRGRGLVISNAGGQVQAFRHQGDLANEDIDGYLARYSDPSQTIYRTEDTRVRTYYDAPASSSAPAAAPVCRT
jgi:hypothetical protein